MENSPHAGGGIADSLSALAANLLVIARTRLELLFNELEEDREHLLVVIVLALVTLFCLGVGVILATILVVVAFWDSHRLLVLGILTGAFLTAGILAWVIALRKVKARPRLLAQTLAELARDREALRAQP